MAVTTANPEAVPPGRAPTGRTRSVPLKDRYSYFVGLMRLTLPMAAVLLVAMIALWPMLDFEAGKFRTGFLSSLKLRDVENLTLVKPQYYGRDTKNRPYSITAELARQDNPESELISLSVPTAEITLADGTWVALTAKTGQLFRKAKSLMLKGEVSVFHDAGYSLRTKSVKIDLAGGNAVGRERVVGYGPLGKLEAQGFRIVDKGRRVFFTGRTHLLIRPGAMGSLQSNLKELSP